MTAKKTAPLNFLNVKTNFICFKEIFVCKTKQKTYRFTNQPANNGSLSLCFVPHIPSAVYCLSKLFTKQNNSSNFFFQFYSNTFLTQEKKKRTIFNKTSKQQRINLTVLTLLSFKATHCEEFTKSNSTIQQYKLFL